MRRALLVLLAAAALLLGAQGLALVRETEPAPQRVIVGVADATLPVGARVLGERVVYVEPVLGFVVVETSAPVALAARARADPGVRYVEMDREVPLAGWTPSDPLAPLQYALAEVRAPEAWELVTGEGPRSLCVVDSGLRWTHEDLRGSRYQAGWDFVAGDAEPWDQIGHGTHVLGIAAASLGNARGVSGLAEAPFFVARSAANGTHMTSHLASAIRWCADVGADVINLSLGGAATTTLREAVLYAAARETLLVAAAGNRNKACADCIDFPAAWPEAIAVTCIGPAGLLPADDEMAFCDFSKEGPQAELAAPGDAILSTMTFGDERYGVEHGTSMSAPHVAGVALLVWNARPELPAALVREILAMSAREAGEPGRDTRFGWGILDARAAVDLVTPASLPVCLLESPRLGEPLGDALLVWTHGEVESVVAETNLARVELAREDAQRWSAPMPPGAAAGLRVRCAEADGDARSVAR